MSVFFNEKTVNSLAAGTRPPDPLSLPWLGGSPPDSRLCPPFSDEVFEILSLIIFVHHAGGMQTLSTPQR